MTPPDGCLDISDLKRRLAVAEANIALLVKLVLLELAVILGIAASVVAQAVLRLPE